jgi:cytochrome c oxidase assembly protein subunit 15
LWNRLPATVDRRVRVLAWLTFVTQVLIVGTGGAVRLTSSGLGCPTWPLCTDASLVATPEMGIHGGIEFGNRLLSIVVGIVAVLLVIAVLRLRAHRDLFGPAVAILALTVLQGLVGGISVRVRLDPSVVGLHFLTSVVLVALATVLVFRTYRGRGALTVPTWYAMLVHLTSAAVAVTVVAGILTTGSGPHAGDDAASRNGLDPELMQHIHSWPAYATLALTLVLVVLALARRFSAVRPFVIALLLVEAAQITVGLTQARTGLPPLLVGTHMVLACLLVAAMTATVLALRSGREVTIRT